MSYLPPVSSAACKVLLEARDKLNRSLVQHLRFKQALGTIRNRILFPTDSNLLFIVGPTGVGKTRLMAIAQKVVLEMQHNELLADSSRIPYVAFEVQATNVGNFAWGPFYTDYLAQLQVPLAPSKESMAAIPCHPREKVPHQALLSAIAHRRPMVTFLDEANHLCHVSNARLLSQQLDKIKSIANRSQTLHVMFGTYELAALLDASSQLARRGNTFHFSRYRWERNGEFNAFIDVIKGFGGTLPLDHSLDLSSHATFIYERTLGCPGILKNWLMDAVGRAFRDNRTFVTIRDLEETAMPFPKLQRLLIEAKNKESILEDTDRNADSFRDSLKAPYAEQIELPLNSTRGGNHSPGTPNPRSDQTGGAFRNEPPKERAG
jgi:hypothetical protein